MADPDSVRVLVVGDIVGKPGRRAFRQSIGGLRKRYAADLVIANCENAAAGAGITPDICEELFAAGADVLTTGNHIWRHREIYDYLATTPRLLRPANFHAEAPGHGNVVVEAGGVSVGVINLMGRVFMAPLACPFARFDDLYRQMRADTGIMVVDFHAEATAEKVGFGRYVDGRASLVVGTHTHVQTADAEVLPGGAGYITDVGMTGPHGGVIGVQSEQVLEKLITQMPVRFQVAEGDVRLCALFAELAVESGRCRRVERICLPAEEKTTGAAE